MDKTSKVIFALIAAALWFTPPPIYCDQLTLSSRMR